MLSKNPTIDRIVFALCLLSMWTLPSIFVWISLFRCSHLSWVAPAALLACSAVMYGIAYLVTFPIGGLRYVRTGSDV